MRKLCFSHRALRILPLIFGNIRRIELNLGLTRIELVTSRLSGVRSNRLSYRP